MLNGGNKFSRRARSHQIPAMTVVLPLSSSFTTLPIDLTKPLFPHNKPTHSVISSKTFSTISPSIFTAAHLPSTLVKISIRRQFSKPIHHSLQKHSSLSSLVGAGFVLAFLATGETAFAAELPLLGSLQLNEPKNALSLPTWAIHVSSVVEWIIAMVLVWKYGERPGYESWKGLSWGMVPLLGGAFCACTWHFFYNSESLSVLVALQAALTVVGNFTMCIAAYRIYKSCQGGSENP